MRKGEKDFKVRDSSRKYYKLFANSLYLTIDLTKNRVRNIGRVLLIA